MVRWVGCARWEFASGLAFWVMGVVKRVIMKMAMGVDVEAAGLRLGCVMRSCSDERAVAML